MTAQRTLLWSRYLFCLTSHLHQFIFLHGISTLFTMDLFSVGCLKYSVKLCTVSRCAALRCQLLQGVWCVLHGALLSCPYNCLLVRWMIRLYILFNFDYICYSMSVSVYDCFSWIILIDAISCFSSPQVWTCDLVSVRVNSDQVTTTATTSCAADSDYCE